MYPTCVVRCEVSDTVEWVYPTCVVSCEVSDTVELMYPTCVVRYEVSETMEYKLHSSEKDDCFILFPSTSTF